MACLQAPHQCLLGGCSSTESQASQPSLQVRSKNLSAGQSSWSQSSFGSAAALLRRDNNSRHLRSRFNLASIQAKVDSETTQADSVSEDGNGAASQSAASSDKIAIDKELSKAVRKTASTFAPRASTKTKNPAVPGSTLYTVFEVQAYVCMALGGLLAFNLVFPSDEPDLWRLMGMWSVWMFTIPSLRARDCSAKEKEALNYLFLLVPLINVTLPLVWRSFAAVWSADIIAFFVMYAWKMEWLGSQGKETES